MSTKTKRLHKTHIAATLLTMCFCLGACDGQTEQSAGAPAAGGEGESRIYWTTTDESGEVVVRSEVISAEQKEALLDARKKNREMSSSERVDSVRRIMTTLGESKDWNVCANYNWTLYTSQPNGNGSFFCSTFSSGPATVYTMPFVPKWFDASRTYGSTLCGGAPAPNTSTCIQLDCYTGPAVRRYIAPGTDSDNLDYPDAQYVVAGNRGPC